MTLAYTLLCDMHQTSLPSLSGVFYSSKPLLCVTWAFTSAPRASRTSATLSRPFSAARWRGVYRPSENNISARQDIETREGDKSRGIETEDTPRESSVARDRQPDRQSRARLRILPLVLLLLLERLTTTTTNMNTATAQPTYCQLLRLLPPPTSPWYSLHTPRSTPSTIYLSLPTPIPTPTPAITASFFLLLTSSPHSINKPVQL